MRRLQVAGEPRLSLGCSLNDGRCGWVLRPRCCPNIVQLPFLQVSCVPLLDARERKHLSKEFLNHCLTLKSAAEVPSELQCCPLPPCIQPWLYEILVSSINSNIFKCAPSGTANCVKSLSLAMLVLLETQRCSGLTVPFGCTTAVWVMRFNYSCSSIERFSPTGWLGSRWVPWRYTSESHWLVGLSSHPGCPGVTPESCAAPCLYCLLHVDTCCLYKLFGC